MVSQQDNLRYNGAMVSTILVVEDDLALVKYLKTALNQAGYSVKILTRGAEVIRTIETINPDLVLLDLNLPDIKGETLCVEIKRDFTELPVIIITAKASMGDKLAAFKGGADDYITKPFDTEELIARINARLNNKDNSITLTIADLTLNKNTIQVSRGGKNIELTPQEFKLLEILLLNQGKVLSREMLLNKIWPDAFDVQSQVVDVYISYLRKKIDADFKKKLIKSSRGFGYCIKEAA